MRTTLRILALLVALAVILTWVGTGAHRGWTQTEITEMRVDAITGIEYPETRAGFVAGLDFLGAGLGAAGLMALVSLCFQQPKHP